MTDQLEPARNDVFRKLGRNIVLFQQLERGLKDFIASRVLAGSTEEDLKRFTDKRNSDIAKKSLGQVVGHLFEELCGDDEPASPPVAPANAFSLSLSFKIEGDDYLSLKRESLRELVEERNRLVHHVLEDFDLRGADGISRLDSLLDPQAERIRTELRDLRTTFEQLAHGRKMIAELINSPEFLSQLESSVVKPACSGSPVLPRERS